jgi:carbamoyltransferase
MTVGVNISHDSSICIKKEKSIEFFEESRFNKNKYWAPYPDDFNYISFKNIKDFNDVFVFACYGTMENSHKEVVENICNKYKIKNFIYNELMHHVYHACAAFHSSPFNEALAVVIDGGGANLTSKNIYRESDSIFYIDNQKVKEKYKSYNNSRSTTLFQDFHNRKKLLKIIELFKNTSQEKNILDSFFTENDCLYRITNNYNPGDLFNHLCDTIGFFNFDTYEPGKAMGLSSYGNMFGERNEDLAKQVQIATEDYTIELIEKALSYDNTKNIVLSGGYFLNCVNNYKYTQHFKDINFFVDPCPHDGGTALGAAVWYDHYK